MKYRKWILAGICLFLLEEAAFGQSIYVAKGKEVVEHKPMVLKLPYAFYNEGFGAAVGGFTG
jgi:hypothetical protein